MALFCMVNILMEPLLNRFLLNITSENSEVNRKVEELWQSPM